MNGVESFRGLSAKFGLSIKATGGIKSALFSTENGHLPYAADSDVASKALINDVSSGVEVQSDSVVLGALAADMAPTTSGFPVDNDEYDLDMPLKGFSSIPEAIEDVRNGKVGFSLDLMILIKSTTVSYGLILDRNCRWY